MLLYKSIVKIHQSNKLKFLKHFWIINACPNVKLPKCPCLIVSSTSQNMYFIIHSMMGI